MAKRKLRLRLPDDPEEFRATIIEHLEELRDRIFRSLIFVGIAWLGGWFAEPYLYSFLNNRLTSAIKHGIGAGRYQEAFRNVSEPFMLQLKLAFIIGLIVALPFLVLQLWGFIAPGLKPSERKPLARVAPLSVLLFCMGVFFCWMVLPVAMAWFAEFVTNFAGATLIQEPGLLVFFALKMLLAFGLGFQIPLVVWVLGAIGLLSSETLMKHWRQGAFAIFVIAAIVTPSNDPTTMLMMAIPLTLLFIISIYAVKITQGRKRKKKVVDDQSETSDAPEEEPDDDDFDY